ncbi:hypothetical protein [Fulvivirga ligni]|uniref:hypothetical protein n=1 Tax=Fulvivirga ligni TaxID=2904246 RepID=UPI001F2FCAFE|nr:hypothetical protein [Fulvivirga ligni]UII19767.1 hypothetical protein LVD16_18145 [Fulvivirga ligni]
MKSILLILLLTTTSLFAQQQKQWIQSLENADEGRYELKLSNLLSKYTHHDFSTLLMPQSEFLGFIGSDYRRIHINYSKVSKDEDFPNVYHLKGSTTVYNNTCDFIGSITIEQVREFKHMYYGVDSMYTHLGMKAQGIIIASYKFNEHPEQQHVGVFEGVMTLWWYLDKAGTLHYYNLNQQADDYKNNQYIGTWREYGKDAPKVCNWGEYRIPFSGDLDLGKGEFSANPKYEDKGW